ncbi:3-deoxy-D-manno-octulosonic acid transferase [Gillisia sp. Q332]|uniref:3-deoxy-D-manno-octulosonic acid transferase n=1 Tax=Gillisia xinjiangensis TaxID=3384765 RepID=UPI00391966AD
MQVLYNITVELVNFLIPATRFLSEKMKLFVNGRKETRSILESKLNKQDRSIWFHMASLGEFEQGVPIIEVVKKQYPHHKIVVSFFSPSGYEVKKNTPLADAVVYLPLDTRKNAIKFLNLVHPEIAIFIKYEFWPNYLKELKARNIRTLLVSGGFRKDHLFFKTYGGWMRNSLQTFEHFFVQNTTSKELLNSIGFLNVTLSGDTRFDRVSLQIEQDNTLDFAEKFKNNKLCIVAGSTWPEDESLLEDFINQSTVDVKFILAPHQIKTDQINRFKKKLNKKILLYSERKNKNLADYNVLIIDTIGLLTKIYSYADIAYVGGAAGTTGLHNILEPATFGVPVVIGKNFDKFPEAKQLQQLSGLFAVKDKAALNEILNKLITDTGFRKKTGMITGHFINSNTGATRIFNSYLEQNKS